MYIYVISAADQFHKIGITSESAERRLKELQTGSPLKLHLSFCRRSDHAIKVERRAHFLLSGRHAHGEWFDVSEAEAIAMVTDLLDDHEFPDAEWTGWRHAVGDVVTCRRSSSLSRLLDPGLIPGRTYTIAAVYQEGQVDVAELPNSTVAHCASMFWPAESEAA